jgi:GH24 family phage-related lysozyme (muramidase)
MPNAVAYAKNLCKQFEGCKLEAYQDMVGVWTIGWGSTGPYVHRDLEIDQDTADEWLLNRLMELESVLEADLKVDLSPEEMGALIDFAYNLGVNALKGSTLWKMINGNETDINAECNQFLEWDHAGHVEVEGLKRRREAEANLFRQGYEVTGK